MKCKWKYQCFHSRKCLWKCCLQNGDHFVQVSMCEWWIYFLCSKLQPAHQGHVPVSYHQDRVPCTKCAATEITQRRPQVSKVSIWFLQEKAKDGYEGIAVFDIYSVYWVKKWNKLDSSLFSILANMQLHIADNIFNFSVRKVLPILHSCIDIKN